MADLIDLALMVILIVLLGEIPSGPTVLVLLLIGLVIDYALTAETRPMTRDELEMYLGDETDEYVKQRRLR